MEIQQIRCPACGAPLVVGDTSEQVTCSYCRTALSLHRRTAHSAALPTTVALPSLAPPLPPPSMTWWRLLFLLDGRIARLQFWLGVGVAVAVLVLANALTGRELDPDTGQRVVTGSFLSTLLLMAGSWVLIAVSVKRLHDRRRSGWWALLYFVPFGIFWLLIDLGFLPGRT